MGVLAEIQSHQTRQRFETFLRGKIKIGLFFGPAEHHKVPCSKPCRFLSDASGQRQLEAPATSRVQRVGPWGGLPGATEGPSKGDVSPYRQHWTQLKKVGAGVGAHLVDSGQDMTLQAFACFF